MVNLKSENIDEDENKVTIYSLNTDTGGDQDWNLDC